jgi:hypothetical protein
VIVWHLAHRPFSVVGGEPTLERVVYFPTYATKIPLERKVSSPAHTGNSLSIISIETPLQLSSSALWDIASTVKVPLGLAECVSQVNKFPHGYEPSQNRTSKRPHGRPFVSHCV